MKLIVLDRDGVINFDSDEYVKSPEEWEAIPGSLEAIARLNRAGYRVVVATNQSGLRRKLFDASTLTQIHEKMHRQLAEIGGKIEAVFFCPCMRKDNCECYKPNPGMLQEIAARLRTSMKGVPFIGDKISDVQAARAVEAYPVLVKTGYGETTLETHAEDLSQVEVHDDLAAFCSAYLDRHPL